MVIFHTSVQHSLPTLLGLTECFSEMNSVIAHEEFLTDFVPCVLGTIFNDQSLSSIICAQLR